MEASFFMLSSGLQMPHNDKICNSYVSYIRHHFGLNTVVVFDGDESSNSTKAPEQQRRASKGVSRDLLFDEQMKTVSTQASFLANVANKSRLIAMIITKFQQHGISTRQADADADSLIASTGLTLAKSKKSSCDNWHLLVILVSQATSEMNVHFCGTNPPIVHDIQAIQKASGHIKIYLMTFHAITGCDTTSALFSHGKKKAFLLAQTDSLDVLEVLENHGSSKEDVTRAGEEFLLKLYGARTFQTLDKHRYTCYNRSIRRSSLSSSFKLESLPPTSAAAKQHSLRTYAAVERE